MRKLAYYEGRTLDPGLVARYFRLAGDVRRVLDVGCGRGCFGRLKPSAGIEVHGVDVDELSVETAGEWETARRVDLDGGSLPYEDGMFDAVFAKDVLEHVREPWTLAREIRRVLRGGGRLVVSVPMEYPWVVWNDYTHVRGFTRDALAGLLTDQGFDDVVVRPMGLVPGAGRLGLVDRIPTLLSLPGLRRIFGRSWEAVATKPREGASG